MSSDNEAKKFTLRMKIKQAERDILNAKEVSDENISFMKYVEGFCLMVNVNGKKVPVNSKTVCFYKDNQNLIKARIASLEAEVSDYEQQLKELED